MLIRMHNKVPFHLLAEIHEIENNLVDSRNDTRGRGCHFILAEHIFFWFIQIFVFFFSELSLGIFVSNEVQ